VTIVTGSSVGVTMWIPFQSVSTSQTQLRRIKSGAMSQLQENSSRRCAVCRGKGRRRDGDVCRGCDGAGKIPARKVRSAGHYPPNTRVIVQWKRASGL